MRLADRGEDTQLIKVIQPLSSLGGDRDKTRPDSIQIEESEDTVMKLQEVEPTVLSHEYEESQSSHQGIDSENHADTTQDTETNQLSQDTNQLEMPNKNYESILNKTVQKYEEAIQQLRNDLGNLRDKYLNAALTVHQQDKLHTHMEGLETSELLIQEMKDLERKTRSKCPRNKEAPLPIEDKARLARIQLWDATLGLRDHADNIQLLEAELRQLETIVPILKLEQKEIATTSTIRPKVNPHAITDVGTSPEYEDLEPLGNDCFRIWVDPQLKAEDFFLVSVTKVPKYHSTAMTLRLEDDNQHSTTLRAIVDSGAAWSAIDEQTLKQNFPDLKILPSDRSFKDASGNLMKVVGRAPLNFFVGDLKLATIVYVFKGLGAAFLLGVNSLHTHQLGLSTQRRVLFSEHPLASKASQATVEFAQIEENCSECRSEGNTESCHCASRNNLVMTCEVLNQQCTLTIRTPTLGTTKVKVYTETLTTDEHLIASQEEPSEKTATPMPDTEVKPHKPYHSLLRTDHTYTIGPNDGTVEIRLYYQKHLRGLVRDICVTVHEMFEKKYAESLDFISDNIHNSRNHSVAFLVSPKPGHGKTIIIPTGTLVAHAVLHEVSSNEMANVSLLDSTVPIILRTVLDPLASPLKWRISPTVPMNPAMVGSIPIVADRCLVAPDLLTYLQGNDTLTIEDWIRLKPIGLPASSLRMSHHIIAADGTIYQPENEQPFSAGGRPRTIDDLHELGFSLEKAIDPNGVRTDMGSYPALPDKLKKILYDIALRNYCVWSRDAKTPELSRLVVIDIPTGNSPPIAQRPYPIPYKYLEAVRKEVQKLIDGGLIEPCISSWASPILVRLKKDSTPEDIRLKLIVDYRRLNEVTVPDAAGLGSQDEILHGFGGSQRYCGIVDAAGGFYQFLINPKHRFKTTFCLPTSMGGTSFQWRVAPYGLTRNPAGYSRGMMYALKGLAQCKLGTDGTGGAASWIDDVSMHADSFDAFAILFETILQRITFAGMSLKASKCYLLHQKLEVLGYYVTPDGLVMQQDKLDALRNRFHKDGQPVGPVTVKEVRIFLGVVQFYKRFVPRLALLAAPMNALLKKYPDDAACLQGGTVENVDMMTGIQQSYEAIMMFLQSSAIVSAPDLQDPLAEYVICPDACDIAVGGVLLQWQWPTAGERGPGPDAGVPLRAGKGTDPLTQSWRLAKGWKLRTIEFYSKTLDTAQRNYPTFDKEGAAVLLCCRKWAQLITCHPTTVYTDSSVAATMLTKHLGPPRLQRWGMELGTFLPYLKIQHRRGIDNGMADFLSRFPTFTRYIATPQDVVYLPEEDYADVAEVPLFTHKLVSNDDNLIAKWRYTLVEAREPKEATTIWQGYVDNCALISAENALPQGDHKPYLESLVSELGKCVTIQELWKEQQEFDAEINNWQQYVDIFEATHGRAPIVYDLYCGEGGFSRGARAVGCECHGFDINTACRSRYENEPSAQAENAPSFMTFHPADVTTTVFWDALAAGELNGIPLPRPDIIHASPPCMPFTRAVHLHNRDADTDILNMLIIRLKSLQQVLLAQDGRPLIWQLENIPESRAFVTVPIHSTALLCGTMMGHQLFRHRLIYSNYPLVTPIRHDHTGKYIGNHGQSGNHTSHTQYNLSPEPVMYGIYSKPYMARGTADEWHIALGATPGTYSARGIVGCLPTGYGRLTAGQMIAHHLHEEYGCPVWPRHEATEVDHLCLTRWATLGYKPLRYDLATQPTFRAITTESTILSEEVDKPVGESIIFKDLPEWQLPCEPFRNTFTISQSEQRYDPDLAFIARSLEGTPDKVLNAHNTLHGNYMLRNGLLYRKNYNSLEQRCLLCVPIQLRTAIMHHYHYADHRGHNPLLNQIMRSYWWAGMHKECETFTATCAVCGGTRSGGIQSVPTQPIPTPSEPFSVIHVDHKGPLPTQPGCEYTNILVVVCALTRFVLFIPTRGTTALETLQLLVSRVFCVFGTPAVIVTDNGPAFRSELSEAASQFYGYRHIHTLPYNPQANGTAEAAVKRIKLLLDRQTQGYVGWQKILPLSQHMLNTTIHTSIGMTPYEALFGRVPIGLEQLENPALYPDGNGNEFLASIKLRMLYLHKSLKQASDDIKNARTSKANKREYDHLQTARRGTVLPSTPGNDKYVWLLHGSKENAAYIRKHGHGAPWRYKYKVLEVKPHGIRLEVPSDGSVPRVLEWQPMRRVAVAHEDEHGPTGFEPYMTEYGYAMGKPQLINHNGADGDVDSTDNNLYIIERIVRAERIGNLYRLWIQWKGHDDITPRWRHELVKKISDPDLLTSIDALVHEARERHKLEHGSVEVDDIDEEDTGVPPNIITTIPFPLDPPSMYDANGVNIASRLLSRKRHLTAPAALTTEDVQTIHSLLSVKAYESLTCFNLAREILLY